MGTNLMRILLGSKAQPKALSSNNVREALAEEVSRLESKYRAAIELRWDLTTGNELREIRAVARELVAQGSIKQSKPDAATETTWWLLEGAQLALRERIKRSRKFQASYQKFLESEGSQS